jgi:hypothetical protein
LFCWKFFERDFTEGDNKMHDIDRTQVGLAGESYEPHAGGPVFNEDEQTSLAAEMMEIGSEQEFEDFLGDLISKATHAIGGFINSPTGHALGGVLKGAAKQLLPMAGQALGGMVGGPAGGQIGGQLASAASGLFEAEMEEREWEAANTFVQLSGEAAKNAASAPPGANPMAVAKQAVVEAAKVHAPALVPALAGGPHANGFGPSSGPASSGRWVRHGRKIILHGVYGA